MAAAVNNGIHKVVAIMNASGNVGKTALAIQIFYANLQRGLYLPVETINAGSSITVGTEEKAAPVSAEHTQKILNLILEKMYERPVILDVGSSNLEVFFREIAKMREVMAAITSIVVPTIPEAKAITDTLNTIDTLIEDLHYPPQNIWVVGNKVQSNTNIELDFARVISKSKAQGFNFIKDVIFLDETFQKAEIMKRSIREVAESESYLTQMLNGTVKKEDREKFAALATFQVHAIGINKIMGRIFNQVMGR